MLALVGSRSNVGDATRLRRSAHCLPGRLTPLYNLADALLEVVRQNVVVKDAVDPGILRWWRWRESNPRLRVFS